MQRTTVIVIGFVAGIMAVLVGSTAMWGPYGGLLGVWFLGSLALVALASAIARDACCRPLRHGT